MFDRLKQNLNEAERKRAEQAADLARKAAEREALVHSIDELVNATGSRERDYRSSYSKHSDETLTLIRDTFATDPKGLIKLLWESEKHADPEEFVQDRLA